MSQVGYVEAAPELPAEGFGQDRQQPSSIFGASGSSLLELDDVPTDLPSSLDLDRIDGPESLPASNLDQLAETVEQSLGSLRAVCRFVQIVGHEFFLSYMSRRDSPMAQSPSPNPSSSISGIAGCGMLPRVGSMETPSSASRASVAIPCDCCKGLDPSDV